IITYIKVYNMVNLFQASAINKMKRLYFIVLLIISHNLNAQNLVPNPGFEYHTPSNSCNYCSNGYFILCFENWMAPIASPDFLSTKCTSSQLKVPVNKFGYQYSHSGIGYCGLDLFEQPIPIPWPCSYREYIQTPLFLDLDSSKTYQITFFVNLTDTSNRALSNIGIYFSDTLIYYPPPIQPSIHVLDFIPQFQNPDSNIITDKIEWVEISGTYLAKGGERYIVIGNFFDDSSSNIITVPGGLTSIAISAYYFIDDIMIRQMDTIHYPAVTGNDTLICFGDSIRLGLYDFSDYQYQWTATTSIHNDSVGNPWVKPIASTTYYLNQTDNYGMQSTDSLTVYVDCFPANAGDDTVFICTGDSLLIGTHNLSWYDYKWSSSYGLGDSTAGITYAKPLTNMRYFLTVTDTLGHITTDSIDIFIVNCFPANAGFDTSICKGDTLLIGSHNFAHYDYSWQAAAGSTQVYGNISDTTIGTPLVWPDTTTSYFLKVIDSIGNISYDTILIEVVNCDTLGVDESEVGFCKVYPNPAKEFIYVSFSIMIYELGIMSYELVDMYGKIVRKKVSFNRERKTSIELSDLPKGIYVLRIMGDNVMIRKKLVLMK
ncbi:T9SS type A sorting domain-containing protein, partial [candidate division KSB1 bacterium]